jgi:hypothetical protein
MTIELKLMGYSFKTIKAYRNHIKRFFEFARKNPEELEVNDIPVALHKNFKTVSSIKMTNHGYYFIF